MPIENKYREYELKRDTNFPTAIHTRINDRYRISSIYRRASTNQIMYFWETFIWDGEQVWESESHYSADKVLEYHYAKYFELGGL